jgi:PiT family inorganic phosphate transporter
MNDVLLVVVVAIALGFDFTNGFHDTANAIATSVGTRAVTPRMAVLIAAVANLAGAFVTTAVAKNVAKGLIDANLATQQTVLAALLGAIVWNLLTWWFGLPSSSSHALIGGLVGAALVQSGERGVLWHGLAHKVVIPALAAPAIAFGAAFLLLLFIYWAFVWLNPGVASRGFRLGQLGTGTWVAFTHGANDAQKTMGVIALALAAAGTTIYLATHYGYPLSTTHVVSGSVMGAGATKRLSAVRWGVAGNIVVAWVLTLPAAAAVAAGFYWPIQGIF